MLRGALVCDSVPATHREALRTQRPAQWTPRVRTGLEPQAGLEERNALEKWKEIQEGHLSHGGVRGGWFRDQGKVYTWAQPGPHLGCYWCFWLNGEEKEHPLLAGVNSGEMSSLKPGERSFSPIISLYLCTFETLPSSFLLSLCWLPFLIFLLFSLFSTLYLYYICIFYCCKSTHTMKSNILTSFEVSSQSCWLHAPCCTACV